MIFNYSPGQLATFYLQTVDADGVRQDGYAPTVLRILLPDLSSAPNFPQLMTRVDVGLYYLQYLLPSTASAVGTYLVDIVYQDPTTQITRDVILQIVVSAPYGLYTALPLGG